MGHFNPFPPPRLNGRCPFNQPTSAGASGNGKGAPITDLPWPRFRPPGSTHLRQSPEAALTLPSSLAQALEHVGVVFWPMPWYAPANKYLERGRRDRNGLLERFLRFNGLTALAEGCGEPAVGRRKIGV
jgi:hypothetical protein